MKVRVFADLQSKKPLLNTQLPNAIATAPHVNRPERALHAMEVRCQCGAVHFTTPTAKPLALYHCHCLECQKHSASAFGTSAVFPYFRLPSDLPLRVWGRKTDSGRYLACYFCINCGVRVMHVQRTNENILSSSTSHPPKTVTIKGGVVEGLKWDGAVHIWCKRAVVLIPVEAERWDGEPPSDHEDGL